MKSTEREEWHRSFRVANTDLDEARIHRPSTSYDIGTTARTSDAETWWGTEALGVAKIKAPPFERANRVLASLSA